MVGGKSGKGQVEKGSRVAERQEVSNHLDIREGGKAAAEKHIEESAKSVHGEEENRGAMIVSPTRKQLLYPANGLVEGPNEGLYKVEKWAGASDPTDVLESEPVSKPKYEGKWKRVRQGNQKAGQNKELGGKLGKRKEIDQITKANREDSSSQNDVISEGKRLRKMCQVSKENREESSA
ncbi:hypothetical protein Q3G72_028036 [Acer saccharum]|nr:hypothetical protein Q3G72_028036 [Acer saccharum]